MGGRFHAAGVQAVLARRSRLDPQKGGHGIAEDSVQDKMGPGQRHLVFFFILF